MKKFLYRKCKTCPYALGQVKCIISPCRECIMSNRKKHPFYGYEREKKLCRSTGRRCGQECGNRG